MLKKSSSGNILVFLALAIFILSPSLFASYQQFLHKDISPAPSDTAEKYFWLTGFPETHEGLYLFTPEQLENDFPGINSLWVEGGAHEINPVVSALQYDADISQPVRLPPAVANIFFQPIPINLADTDILSSLPGIGPALAKKIVQRRNQHGSFKSKDELLQIAGIGPKKFAGLVDHINAGLNLEWRIENGEWKRGKICLKTNTFISVLYVFSVCFSLPITPLPVF